MQFVTKSTKVIETERSILHLTYTPNVVSSQVGALHRVSSGEELCQPLEQRRLTVCRGWLRHGSDGEQGGDTHRGHWRLAVSHLNLWDQYLRFQGLPLCLFRDLTLLLVLLGMRMIKSSGVACWGRCVTLPAPPVCPWASTLPGCQNCRQNHFLSFLTPQQCHVTPPSSLSELPLRRLIPCTRISVSSWSLT